MSYSVTVYSQKYNAEKVYQKTNGAVVRILTYHDDNTRHSQGSGVILKDRGWIVTNYHLVGDASVLFAEHNGKLFQLDSIIAIDTEKDILILKFRLPDEKRESTSIPSLKLKESKHLRVGQKVFAIGSPFGFENTITEGIISGLRTSFDNSQSYIQISAPISPGSSGGAILNEKGELIGISTMVVDEKAAQNLNFAILVEDVVDAGTKRVGSQMVAGSTQLLKHYYEQGYSDYLGRRYLSAIRNYHIATQYATTEEKGTIHFMIGLTFQKSETTDSAIYYLEKAAFTNKIPNAYTSLGNLYLNRSDLAKAEEYFQRAVDLSPKHEESYIGLSKIAILMQEYPKAILNLKKVLEVNPRNVQALFYTGLVASFVNRTEDAIHFLSESIKLKPDYADAYLILGDVYMAKSEMAKAIEYQQKAFQLNPALRNRIK